jgi:hypothetical protein
MSRSVDQCDLGGCQALIADFYDALSGRHDIFAGQRQGARGPPSSSALDTWEYMRLYKVDQEIHDDITNLSRHSSQRT